MGLVQTNNVEDFVIPKRLAELNQHMRDEQRFRVGITGEGQDLSMEDESQIHENINGDENNGQIKVIEIENHSINQKRNKKIIQGPLVRWERFLPIRSLKVLLVENDDSTRHVICALLRNCGYEVEAVVNGQEAWRILKDLTTNIDLVLTEVALPYLTGIGLLSKVMGHKMLKNIPVIMMSSYDPMNIVFKCLSKGAIDFLVKPLRKNEVKNLWQHVWRKCHSSSGSGSESSIRTQKSLKYESGEHSDNKHDNRDKDDIGSIGLNVRDKSDNGSGTQSSWSKIAVEVDSPRPMSLWEESRDPPLGSTCAKAIHSMHKTTANNKVVTVKDNETQNALDMMTGTYLEITASRSTLTLQPCGQQEDAPSSSDAFNNSKSSEKENIDEKEEKGQVKENSTGRLVGEYKNQATSLTSVDLNVNSDPISEIHCLESPNGMVSNNVKEFSSNNLNGTVDIGSSVHDHNVLKQSHRSAFSRYNSRSHQGSTSNVGSCSPIDNSSEAAKTESVQGMQIYFNSMPPNNLHPNGNNNNHEQGSSSNIDFTKSSATIDELTQKATIKYIQSSSTSQFIQNMSLQPVAQENGDKQHIQVKHHHHHYHHHHHHHMHDMVARQLVNQNGQSSLQIRTTTSLKESSTNPLSAPINKSNNGDQSYLNGSAFESQHGSNNVDLGSNTTLPAGIAGNLQEHDNNNMISEKEGATSLMILEAPNITIQNQFA